MQELDLPRLVQFEAYYAKHPPLHIMVANYLGYKAAEQPSAQAPIKNEVSASDFSALVEHMPVRKPEKFMTAEEYLQKRGQHGG